ncbi:MAG: hypothetical protein QNJ16_13170 [Rhodobacter sp.]|nr:hypothetical protein [Rhodobacter sp.]
MAYRRKHDRHWPRGWFSLFLRLGGWASLALGVGLLVVTAFSAGTLYLADRFDREGRLAYAVVADMRVVETVDDDGDVARDHFVTFTYKTRGGGGRTQEVEVSAAYFGGVAEGDERAIRYLASDPGRVEVDIGRYRRTGVVLRWIGLGLGVLGLAALWLFGAQANRAVKVRRDGEKRFAEVSGITETNVRVNGRRQGRLTWREADGRVGRSLMRDAGELRGLYRPGDRIVVFRLGRHAFWEGDVGPPRREVEG